MFFFFQTDMLVSSTKFYGHKVTPFAIAHPVPIHIVGYGKTGFMIGDTVCIDFSSPDYKHRFEYYMTHAKPVF